MKTVCFLYAINRFNSCIYFPVSHIIALVRNLILKKINLARFRGMGHLTVLKSHKAMVVSDLKTARVDARFTCKVEAAPSISEDSIVFS